ncbi:MAG: Ig-like domain-containing protein [Actinobacteria bacterium]|nr:Ig-like domain-containing protein [Actinomycetota bacterium]
MRTLASGRTPVRRIATAMAAALALLAAGATALPAAAADERINVALASGENAPTTEVSYVTGWNSAAALNNGATAATNTYTQMWGTWGAPGNPAQDTASYTWERPVTVSSSTLYLWQNHLTGDSGVMLPSAWSIQYRTAAGEWAPVTGASLSYPLPVLDQAAPVSSLPPVKADFDAVTTTGVRLVLDRAVVGGERKATSVIEWQVWGVHAPETGPGPDSAAFLDVQKPAVRTVTGTAPSLPAEVWAIGEDGPLVYVPVDWADVAPSSFAAPGAFEVTGSLRGHDGEKTTATVHVADAPSTEIRSLGYSATITTPGAAPVLPREVRARFADATEGDVPVTWSAIEAPQYAEAGMMFDVSGAVEGFAGAAVATVFVVEPAGASAPLVSIGLDAAPEGSGWYTAAPTATVTAESAGAIRSVEYSLDGTTWKPYGEPFAVDAQGEITVHARATDAAGAVGEASETVRVDTVAPVTGVSFDVVGGSSARVTLTPTDAEPGSGVTRTVWSDGPDSSPTGEANNMYATYEAPFSVQLTEEPRYVHVQTQDAAGNVERYVTVELPARAAGALALDTSATGRCVAGKAQLVVTVRNTDTAAADVELTTPYGSKTVALAPGKGTSSAFSSRAAQFAAGQITVSGSAGDRSYTGSLGYAAVTCG